MAIVPMFPLGSVLLPGAPLSLHVFEPRYRQLVQDCVRADAHEFGVVLIERGSEVGGGDVRRDVGTMARMLQVAELPGDRFAVLSVGDRRIRVRGWLPDDPYPLAEVDDWPEEGDRHWSGAGDHIESLVQRVRRAPAVAIELGDLTAELGVDPDLEFSDEPTLAGFRLSTLAPLGDVDRYALLSAPGPRVRLALLGELLGEVEALLRFRLGSP